MSKCSPFGARACLTGVLFASLVGPASAQVTWTRSSMFEGRWGHAMAHDSVRGRVVLFGGHDGSGELSETWEWDGSTWSQRSPATIPAARHRHAMSYDAARGRAVLFGGMSGTAPLSDTWEWDGTNWIQRFPTTSPPARYGHALAFDRTRARATLFGGSDATSLLA